MIVSIFKKDKWWLWLIPITLFCFYTSIIVTASGLGGYISEKLIKDSVDGSVLVIDRAGVNNSNLDVAMSGYATISVSNVYMDGTGTHATLHGNLLTLNGFDNATAYFQWGYDTNYGHTTPSQTLTTVGDFSQTISGFNPSNLIYCRVAIVDDGTNYSTTVFNPLASGRVDQGFNLLNAVLLLVYASFIIVAVLVISQESTIGALIFATVAIYIGVYFEQGIQSLLNKIFGG